MAKKPKEKHIGNSWKALFRTIYSLKLPWLLVALSLVLNLTETTLLLKLPVTTASLMSGNITGAALSEAIVYYILTGGISIVAVAVMVNAQAYSVRKTRETVWKKMLGMKMEYFDRNDPSELMSSITSDANAAFDFVNIILNLIPAIYYVVSALITIGDYHWGLALACFILFPIKYIYAFVMGRVYQTSNIRLYNRIGALTGYLADRITHLNVIKTHTNEPEELEKGEQACNELLKVNMRIVHQGNIAEAMMSVMDILQQFTVVVVAVILLRQNRIDLAVWLAFFLFSQSLFPNIDQIFNHWTTIKGIQGSFYRITEIMQSETEQNTGTVELLNSGDICFKNVTFTYPETETPALDNVSFTVKRGQSAAIVGLCGSGKTTTISLLERLYSPNKGQVLIGNTDIRDFSLAEYRKQFAYMQQGAMVFSGTLRELLTYGLTREVSDREILEAAQKTGFDEYLSLCEQGLNTEVAPGGNSMSGGQNQRLVLTRELLRGGNIILMDEPTSALDVRVSAKIQQTIDTVFADKTRILVTHDLRLAQKYSVIFVMENGKLVGQGTHESLLKNCKVYQNMLSNAKEER